MLFPILRSAELSSGALSLQRSNARQRVQCISLGARALALWVVTPSALALCVVSGANGRRCNRAPAHLILYPRQFVDVIAFELERSTVIQLVLLLLLLLVALAGVDDERGPVVDALAWAAVEQVVVAQVEQMRRREGGRERRRRRRLGVGRWWPAVVVH